MQCEELICKTIFVSVDKVLDFLFIFISSFLTPSIPKFRWWWWGVGEGGLNPPPLNHHTNDGPANLKEMQCKEFICDTIFVGVDFVDKVMMIIE